MATPLHGQCACGRNQYIITVPEQSTQLAQVVFDNSSHARRLQASPLTAFLKIPLTWFESTTVAFYPDETHQTIRRTFSTPSRENLSNQFCGYCGTQLSQWDDSSPEANDFVWLTLGSLLDDDLDQLEALGILDLDNSEEEEAKEEDTSARKNSVFDSPQLSAHRGAPWFEEAVEDTKLGRIKRQKGGYASADGSESVEWEVMEWTSTEDDTNSGKRKLEESHEERKKLAS
ncbi:hypothetical protein BT63DRAFT_427054 [Microthyrium microscopicum]|uniref:CENP-V/GFA domain-containing protein n=1 Tax=Microthyrium microscopicum TaxID=703497 RepID=A0A6A6U2W8_9PEZI|nr:hypothetical protein BT63DRAFT_427054 [Microthyrium microscopicum]